MKMKFSLIAGLLIITMAISIVGCGKNNENKDGGVASQSTSTTQDVSVGTILNVPEATTANVGKASFKVISPSGSDKQKQDEMFVAFDMTGKDIVLYVADGEKMSNSVVYEIGQGSNSKVASYYKNATSNAYKKDKKKMKVVAKEALEMLSFLEVFGIGVGTMTTSQYRYKKCEDEKSEIFGDVYVYELLGEYSDDETYGYIWVDKESGVWVKTLDNDKEEVCSIQELELENVEIPVYK